MARAGVTAKGTWPWRWRVARTSATLGALVVLALVIAHWGWRWFGPPPTPIPPRLDVPESPAAVIAATPWFGSPEQASANVAAAASSPPATDMRLLGTIVNADGSGYALFRVAERGPILVAAGSEVTPGVTLRAVSTTGVRLDDRGQMRDIELRVPHVDANAPAATTRMGAARGATVARTSAACVPPGGASTAPYRLNAELLTGIAAKPQTWSNVFTATDQGLSIAEGNAFGAMLGMRAGDRVAQANGVALRGADDVLAAVIRPLLANQAVRVTGLRDGRPIEWVFVNAGACPA